MQVRTSVSRVLLLMHPWIADLPKGWRAPMAMMKSCPHLREHKPLSTLRTCIVRAPLQP